MSSLNQALRAALDHRQDLLAELHQQATDCYRLFHGSQEGAGGLTIDRYGPQLLVQSFHQTLERDALLQLLFIALAAWGWWLWLRGAETAPLRITQLTSRQRLQTVLAGLVLWALTGCVLLNFTDTDVPWWDAFPTAFSLVGQYLLAHKRVENWCAWLLVNVVAIGLFAWKELWLTTVLYIVFALLSVVGWRAWQQRSHGATA